MLAVAVASVVGILVDPRTITGAPAWLKPFKFAVSTAVYSLTLAWVFGFLGDWPRVRRFVGWTTAIVFVLEVAIIDAQAWRGSWVPQSCCRRSRVWPSLSLCGGNGSAIGHSDGHFVSA
jgi:hypothetical protein